MHESSYEIFQLLGMLLLVLTQDGDRVALDLGQVHLSGARNGPKIGVGGILRKD